MTPSAAVARGIRRRRTANPTAKVSAAGRNAVVQPRRVKWWPSPWYQALPTAQSSTTAAAQAATRQVVWPCSARWTAVPRNITASMTRISHCGTVLSNATRASAGVPPSTPPATRGAGVPALAQQTATARATAATAISGPVRERADGGEHGQGDGDRRRSLVLSDRQRGGDDVAAHEEEHHDAVAAGVELRHEFAPELRHERVGRVVEHHHECRDGARGALRGGAHVPNPAHPRGVTGSGARGVSGRR